MTTVLRLSLLALLLASCGKNDGDTGPRPSARRPDVLLFVVDTLRKDHLSCYGYPRATSPELDRIAAEGALFLDPVAQCSWTKPSMVSLFGGRYITSYRDIPFKDGPTLAETFQAAGYRTLGVVGNVLVSEESGFARGFDRFDARRNEDPGKAKGELGRPLQSLARDLWPVLEQALEPDEDGERAPLFVYVHAMDPHNPYLPHPDLDGELPIGQARAMDAAQRALFAAEGAPPPEDDPDWKRAWRRMQISRGRYDQEIRHTDQVLGEMLDRYRELGLLEHALFALVADHGEVLYDHPTFMLPGKRAETAPHQYFHKEHGTFQFQSLIGTPFILWGAGVPAGTRVESPVENIDLYPTLVELAGLEAPAGLQGRSLVPLMRGEEGAPRPYVFSFVMQNLSVRETATDLKLILPTEIGAGAGLLPALYDLRTDPDERHDLHGQRPEDVARLTAELHAWRERFPTVTTLGRVVSREEQADLAGLGYTDGEEEAEDGSATDGERSEERKE